MGYFYPNGLSDKSGAHRLLSKPIYTSSSVNYVHSADGDDSWNGGYNAPKATLGAADAIGRIVVLKTGSAEVLTSALLLTNGCTVVGETSAGGVPEATMALNHASATMFTLSTVTGVQFCNVKFPEQVQSNSGTSRVIFTTAGQRFTDCSFEADVKDDGGAVVAASGVSCVMDGCSFLSTGTTVADQLAYSFLALAATDFRACDLTLDVGAFGSSFNRMFDAATGSDNHSVYELVMLNGTHAEVDTAGTYTMGLATGGSFLKDDSVSMDHYGQLSTTSSDKVLAGDLRTTGTIYFIDSVNGSDSNPGTSDEPFATMAPAISDSEGNPNDIFFLRSGHTETITTTLGLDTDGWKVIAEDSTVTVDVAANVNGFSVTGANVELRGIRFTASAALSASNFIVTATDDSLVVEDCAFVCSANIGAAALNFTSTADYSRVINTTFTSTATDVTARPVNAIRYSTGVAPMLESVTFDGGTVGFDDYALDANSTISYVRFEGVTLKNRADARIGTSATGYFQVEAESDCVVEAF